MPIERLGYPYIEAQKCELEIQNLGVTGEKIGRGFHTDVHRFSPYSGRIFDIYEDWVVKFPRLGVRQLNKWVGYDYGKEVRMSKAALQFATEEGLEICYSEPHFVGDEQFPTIIQKFVPGNHPKIGESEFEEQLAQILYLNRALHCELGATFDMQHFVEKVMWNGPQKGIPLDNFIVNNSNISLIDFQLIYIYPDDTQPVAAYKLGLLECEKAFFRSAFGMDFI